MRTAKGFSIENDISIKLLLALAVRKGELIGARWCEFDLDEGLWHLPEARTKTSTAITIPLSNIVVNWFKELKHLSCGNDYVLPARKMQDRMIPHNLFRRFSIRDEYNCRSMNTVSTQMS